MGSVTFKVHSSLVTLNSALDLIKKFENPESLKGLEEEIFSKLEDYLCTCVLSKGIDVSFEKMVLSDIKFDGYFADITFSSLE